MEAVKIVDAGERIMVTGTDRAAVSAALEDLVRRGATVLGEITRVGTKFTATTSQPAPSPDGAAPEAADWMGELEQIAAMSAITVSDTGTHLILAGNDRDSVESALERLAAQGVTRSGPVARMGARWIGSCIHPEHARSPCTVEQLGLKVVVSALHREQVDAKLEELQRGGATLIAPPELRDGQWTAIVDLGEKQQGMRFY